MRIISTSSYHNQSLFPLSQFSPSVGGHFSHVNPPHTHTHLVKPNIYDDDDESRTRPERNANVIN